MSHGKCNCGCGGDGPSTPKSYQVESALKEGAVVPLTQLPLGACGDVTEMDLPLRARQKLSDVGLIPGARVALEAFSPLHSLCRVRIMGASLAISSKDASRMFVRVVKLSGGVA